MRRMQNSSTIITEKESQLNGLIKDSESAVDMITTTINRLVNVNERISTTRHEIETYKSELERIDGSMEQQFTHNARVIEKFKSFIED